MLILAAAIAFAQPAADARPRCTPAQAEATSIEAITASPERWLDRCVTVSGIASGIQLYSGLEELYRASRFAADGNHDPANLRHRIGIDSQELRAHPELGSRATRVRVTGVVDSCQRRSQRIIDAGGVPFLGGYCHYHSGPTIVATSYEVSNERFERLVGEAARQRAGNLALAPANWRHREAVQRIAARFLTAVRARDRATLAGLHAEYGERQREEVLTWLLDNPASPFRSMREQPQTEILISFREGVPPGADANEHFGAEACFCRVADCSRRWPIALRDADNGAERPYACIHVERRPSRPLGAIVYTVPGGGWLAEPRRR